MGTVMQPKLSFNTFCIFKYCCYSRKQLFDCGMKSSINSSTSQTNKLKWQHERSGWHGNGNNGNHIFRFSNQKLIDDLFSCEQASHLLPVRFLPPETPSRLCLFSGRVPNIRKTSWDTTSTAAWSEPRSGSPVTTNPSNTPGGCWEPTASCCGSKGREDVLLSKLIQIKKKPRKQVMRLFDAF